MSHYDTFFWEKHTRQLWSLLNAVEFSASDGQRLPIDQGFKTVIQFGIDLRRHKKTLFCIGNGASASMGSHFAADLMKNAHIKTAVFTDPALMTAVANDLSFEDVYAHPLSLGAREGDCLLAISSSGRSPNIISALTVAKEMRLTTISLTAMQADNPARSLGDLNIYFPAKSYGLAETVHAALLHCWTDALSDTQNAASPS